MRVYKFGGASIADSSGFKRVGAIMEESRGEPLMIIVSALGKTTNALEQLCRAYYHGEGGVSTLLAKVKQDHETLARELFGPEHRIFDELNNLFIEIEWIIEEPPHTSYGFIYDQIVSIGELVSSQLLSGYLTQQGIANVWVDSRNLIQTDNQYREASVNWIKTCERITRDVIPRLATQSVVGQGFIGGTSENYTTTLGREGSDYSAAIFASCLKAESLTVWKDVPGLMNADPQELPQAQFIPAMSYTEMAELAYYGARVIHPKTIKPLMEQSIPLYLKSFLTPHETGTCVSTLPWAQPLPVYILKRDQLLVSLYSLDGGFILEEHLQHIYGLFAGHGVSLNLAVNSALSFSALIDQRRFEEHLPPLLVRFSEQYSVRFNENLELLTVRHPDLHQEALNNYLDGKEVFIEVSTRQTLQKVLRKTR